MGVAGALRQPLQRRAGIATVAQLRQEFLDPVAHGLRLAIAEDPLGGGIEGQHDAKLIQRQHHILDVVQDDLQVIRALLLGFERQRARLIGHELHGAHDATALLIDGGVVTADEPEQRRGIGLVRAGAQLQFAQLREQQRMQCLHPGQRSAVRSTRTTSWHGRRIGRGVRGRIAGTLGVERICHKGRRQGTLRS